MMENIKKHRQLWLVLPIVICMGIILPLFCYENNIRIRA